MAKNRQSTTRGTSSRNSLRIPSHHRYRRGKRPPVCPCLPTGSERTRSNCSKSSGNCPKPTCSKLLSPCWGRNLSPAKHITTVKSRAVSKRTSPPPHPLPPIGDPNTTPVNSHKWAAFRDRPSPFAFTISLPGAGWSRVALPDGLSTLKKRDSSSAVSPTTADHSTNPPSERNNPPPEW